MTDNLNSLQDGVGNISPIKRDGLKINRLEFFKKCEEVLPLSIYALAKKLDMAYNTCSSFVRELEFVGLLKTQVLIGDNNRAMKMVYLNDGNDLTFSKGEGVQ